MVQLRRLDPLANKGPYQRLLKSPVKSFSLTEPEYDRLREQRPELIVREGELAVIGRPFRDHLEIHYGFPEVEAFRDRFFDMLNRVTAASSEEEAPRGLLLSFRDRPNRALAEMIFWSLALEQGRDWVELSHVAVPEQPEPDAAGGAGFRLREVTTDADRDALAAIEAELSGQPRLTPPSLAAIIENAALSRLVLDDGGTPVGYMSLVSESGWGVIERLAVRPSLADSLLRPLTEWSVAWLRNNGRRRIRQQIYMEDSAALALSRDIGFTAGESGIEFSRLVDAAEVKSKMEERKAHGSIIRFGDWR